MKRKDDQKLIVLESATAVRDEHSKIVAYRGIIHDLTERKQLEEQLFHAQKMETVATLACEIAHDFNNLLTVILGNAEFGMQDSKLSDRVYQDLIRIKKAASQARNLIRQLLGFSRQPVPKPKLLNLNETIKEFLKMLKGIIRDNIDLKAKLAPNLAPVRMDTVSIQQVFIISALMLRTLCPRVEN